MSGVVLQAAIKWELRRVEGPLLVVLYGIMPGMTLWSPQPGMSPIGLCQWFLVTGEWSVPLGPEFCFIEDEVWNCLLESDGEEHRVRFNVFDFGNDWHLFP